MARGSGAICYCLRQTLWKCEDAGSSGTIIESPCANNMANGTAIDDDEHQEATCQEATLSEPQDVIPTKNDRALRLQTREICAQWRFKKCLLTRCRCPYKLPIASSGDWFVRMPVSYIDASKGVIFLLPGLELLLWLREIVLFGALCAA